jgi:toxin ParE1/3/4
MQKYEVSFRPLAETDLRNIYQHIAEQSGVSIAGAYLNRIEAACMQLQTFPHRGTQRDDIRIGLRTLGFERRATILFRVLKDEVIIVRVFYGGQDYQRLLTGSADE